MKFGYYMDIHWSAKPPIRRLDDYTTTVERKHRYIYHRAHLEGCEVMVSGGDINEYPLMANSVVNRQIAVLREKPMREFSIYGNHDVIGNNADKAEQVSASILFNAGYLEHIGGRCEVFESSDGIRVGFVGVDIHKDMDNLRPEDYCVERPDGIDYLVLVAHGWLTDKPLGLEGVKHTTFQDVVSLGTGADLILTAHYHPGYGTRVFKQADGREVIFHSPGSPVRVKASVGEMNRRPCFSIVHLERANGRVEPHIELIEFPEDIARPAEEVLDRDSLLAEQARQEAKQAIEVKYAGVHFKASSPREIIMQIASETELPLEAKQDLIERLEAAEAQKEAERLKGEV